jgi:hypothetical protein
VAHVVVTTAQFHEPEFASRFDAAEVSSAVPTVVQLLFTYIEVRNGYPRDSACDLCPRHN